MFKHTLDPAVLRQRAENCDKYRRHTEWLLPVTLCSTLTSILFLGLGPAIVLVSFTLFAVGLLVAGVRLSMTTALLYCPHCGRRSVKSFKAGYSQQPLGGRVLCGAFGSANIVTTNITVSARLQSIPQPSPRGTWCSPPSRCNSLLRRSSSGQ
jgi:hypothetical protein